VRLALEALAEAGVVEIALGRGGGARVTSIWIPDRLVEKASEEPRAEEIFQMLEARRTLEPRVVQLAALRATDAGLDELRRCIELEASQLGDWGRMVEADLRSEHAEVREVNAHDVREVNAHEVRDDRGTMDRGNL